MWPCVSVCVCEQALWGKWRKPDFGPGVGGGVIIGINKGPDPLISSAQVAEESYNFTLKYASRSKGMMLIGNVFKSLTQKIIKNGSAASVVLRRMCHVPSKFCNVL